MVAALDAVSQLLDEVAAITGVEPVFPLSPADFAMRAPDATTLRVLAQSVNTNLCHLFQEDGFDIRQLQPDVE